MATAGASVKEESAEAHQATVLPSEFSPVLFASLSSVSCVDFGAVSCDVEGLSVMGVPWVGPVEVHGIYNGGERIPLYLGTLAAARTNNTAVECLGEDSLGHLHNVTTSVECLPGTCHNNYITCQTFPVTRSGTSAIHNLGLFVAEHIEISSPIIECAGSVVDDDSFMWSMGRVVREGGFASFWKLSSHPNLTINACSCHNNAVFANHSCNPNS